MNPSLILEKSVKAGDLSEKLAKILVHFFDSYLNAIRTSPAKNDFSDSILLKYIELVIDQIKAPYSFDPFHKAIRQPFDYYQFGLDLIRPLIIFEFSRVYGLRNLEKIQQHLNKNENVILFANHQTEPDPQVISLLLEKKYPRLAEEMIFVAGHRVITDPLAIPLSMGRNLLCIFSKKYLENPPEEKEDKLQHNQRVMKQMKNLLSEGGRCIYVAPSGGRDRPNLNGKIEVAPFDSQSIEMFWLMAKQSNHPTHFYPLALRTYDLLPPPHSVKIEIGEKRNAKCTPVQLAFGEEIPMENIPCTEHLDKRQKRQARAEWIWNLVKTDYHNLLLKN